MELRHLATFLRVVRLHSFTAAAGGLGYAQSTVTGHVKVLESTLGVELFDRSTGRIELTEAGERLLPFAERLVDLADEARLAVKEPGTHGTVLVGAVESIATYRLSPVVEFFHHRFPELRLVVRTSSCPDTELALRRGELDLGFIMATGTSHPGLSGIVLCREDLIVVAAPDHPLVGQPAVTTDELRKATILNTEYGCPYREAFEAALDNGSWEQAGLLEFGTIQAIKLMAANGLGVALLPRFTVAQEVASGELAEIAWPVPFTFSTQLAWRKGKWISKAHQLFIDQTASVFCADS
jgi:DNA-binding transcriptional LysR family regulator